MLFSGTDTLVSYPGGRKDSFYDIPEGVKEIRSYAFSGAHSLKRVSFPKSLETITLGFCGSGLEEVEIPEGIRNYDGAFSDCTVLEKAVIDTRANADWAFKNCTGLKTAVVSGKISGSNFSGCRSLENFALSDRAEGVVLQNGVLYSDDTSVLIAYPAGKKEESFTIPAGTKAIADSALSGVQYLREVVANSELQRIGDGAFDHAEISAVRLNQGLQEIGAGAFSSSALMSLTMPDSVQSIGSALFSDCKRIQSVKLSASIQEIPSLVFLRCTSLKSLHIPKGVKKAEWGGFSFVRGCKNLTGYTVDPSNKYYAAPGGVLHSKSKKTLYAYPPKRKGKKYTVSKSVKKIISGAFSENLYLQEVILKDKVEHLENEVFKNAAALKKVTLPKNLKNVGYGLFEGCKKLQNITIPDNVSKLEWSAFEGCTSVKIITIGKKVKWIGSAVFKDCRSLRKLTFRGKKMKFDQDQCFAGTGSKNVKKLTVSFPKCSKKDKKRLKKEIYQAGISKKAKLVFG